MKFHEVLGQDNLKQQLIKMADSGKPAHALLFSGREGNGAFALALAYIQYLNCENIIDHDSCGQCNSCNKIQKLIHPDLTFSFPAVKKRSDKPSNSYDFISEWRTFVLENKYIAYKQWMKVIADENKQGNISAEECNGIIKKISLKHFEAKYKIVLIWLAELLGTNGNRLLKVIEEPPANTIFILITNKPEKILGTIQSRTQIINVPNYSDDEIRLYLKDNYEITDKAASQFAILADGQITRAINIFNEEETDYSEIMLNWFRSVFKNDTVRINQTIDEIAALKREGQKNFIDYCSEMLRDTLLYKFRSATSNRLSENENKLIQFLASKVLIEQFEMLNSSFEKLHFYIQRNGNARIQFFYLYTRHIAILK